VERDAVFVFGEDPLPGVFTSMAEAAGDMETLDVENGEYHALYSVDGCRVRVSTASGSVRLEVTDERDVADLRRRLREWAAVGHLASDPDDLVAVANELLRDQWDVRWPKRPGWLSRRVHGAGPPEL
jgi:hypothetical protein